MEVKDGTRDTGPAVEVGSLIKRYGELVAVDGLSLKIPRGQVLGLLGPNGSGKTTTINCILQLLAYDKGSIRVFGEPMTPTAYELKRRIGVVPQDVAVFDELTVAENVNAFCALYVRDRTERRRLVAEAIGFVGLEKFVKFKPKKLSGGLLRRLNIACGIAHGPDLIILDEPTVGLDPKQIIEIRELIRKLAKEHTVILSSHILAEIREVCDYILIIARGKLVASDTPENLENSMSGTGHIEIEVRREQKEVERVLDRIDQVKRVEYTLLEDGTVRAQIEAKGSGDIRERIFHAFADQKMPLLTLKLNKSTLEEIFLELTQK